MAVLFTLIVPVYNVERFLKRCLDSIRRQTCTDYEVLLIDDGSTDSSGRICDEYAGQYEQFRVIHKENTGASDSRNVGLSMAKGKYIVFLDSDDYIEKEMLGKVYEQMEVQGYDVCSFAARRVDEENNFLYEFRYDEMTKPFRLKEQNRDLFLWQYFLQYKVGWEACFYVFRRNIIEEHQIRFDVELTLAEDLLFTFEYLLYAECLIKLPDILYNYTFRKDSVTRHFDDGKEIENIFGKVFEKLKQVLYEKNAKRYGVKNISVFYAVLLYYFSVKSEKNIPVKRLRSIFQGLYNYDSQRELLYMLLLQRKTLQRILGAKESDKLCHLAEYLLFGNLAMYKKRCARLN